ncbi:MAG: MGMT family protein [Bacteroidota bacterium]
MPLSWNVFFTAKAQKRKVNPRPRKGTNFQVKVWEALLKLPIGSVTTYQNIAEKIKNPKQCKPWDLPWGQIISLISFHVTV